MNNLKKRFDVHCVDSNTYLGFQIDRPHEGTIFLHQAPYVKRVLERFNMVDAKPEESPCSGYVTKGEDETLSPETPYREAIGSLMYASNCTRADIAFAVNKASRAVSNPTVLDWNNVKRIFRYLFGNLELGQCYRQSKNQGLEVYCDADFAGDVETSKSTTGAVILFAGAPIHWRSKRQTMVTTSSTEAEYVSLCSTLKDLVWIRKLATELQIIDSSPTLLYCDNQSAIRLASNEKSCQRTKHMRVQEAYAKEQIDIGEVKIEHKRTDDQLADMLTKRLSAKKFKLNRDKIMTSKTSRLTTMLILLLMITGCSTYRFDTIKPIIYQPLQHFVEEGTQQYVVEFVYNNPCDIIMDTYKQNKDPNLDPSHDPEHGLADTLHRECDQSYSITWLKKISDLKQAGEKWEPDTLESEIIRETRSIKRKERDLTTGLVIGYCITNFLKTLFSPFIPGTTEHTVLDLKSKQATETERINKFKKELNITQTIQNGMIEMIKSNARSIRERNRQLNHFAIMSGKMTWLASYIQTRLLLGTADLPTIVDIAKKKQVATMEMSELLNITALRNIEPVDTEFVSIQEISSNTIQLKFNVLVISPESGVYRIHSFRHWDNLTEIPTLMEYDGSRIVLFNKTANCALGIEEPNERFIHKNCSVKNYMDPKLSIWKPLISTHDIYRQHDMAIWKPTLRYNYLYCFPWNITISNAVDQCPPKAFRLPLNVNFDTKGEIYVSVVKQYSSRVN